ncbi:hypothetical protein [Nonomuraea typhae]|uniref:Exo-alpha-sialidase n=1 Tax=Nonomuraea typhae TaxID=2603600 RepID=A0ABW7YT35_9ACTN
MTILGRLGLTALLLSAACTAQAPPPRPAGQTPAVALGAWKEVAFPKADARADLVAMSVTGPRAAWAGGYEDTADDQAGVSLLMRWNGTTWAKVAVPAEFVSITALDDDGAGGVWIADGSLVARWSAGRWRTYEPFGIARDRYFTDLAAEDGRVLLVGSTPQERAMVVEWDGKEFRLDQRDGGELKAVSLDRGHAWAVGAEPYGSGECPDVTPLILRQSPEDRKNGQGLRAVQIPEIPGGVLRDVWQVAPDDVWAVGSVGGTDKCGGTPSPEAPLVMRWDGAAWKRVELPAWDLSLRSVTVTEDGHVWAGGRGVTLAHFDGRTWTRERPLVSGREDVVRVHAMPGGPGLWAFGSLEAPTMDELPFILRR